MPPLSNSAGRVAQVGRQVASYFYLFWPFAYAWPFFRCLSALFQTPLSGAEAAKNIAAIPSPTNASRSAYSTRSCARWQIANRRHPRICLSMVGIFILVGTRSRRSLLDPYRLLAETSMPDFAFYRVKVPLSSRVVGVELWCTDPEPLGPSDSLARHYSRFMFQPDRSTRIDRS